MPVLDAPIDLTDMTGRAVLITGGNAGIGKETAVALAGAGATVVFTARNAERGADALAEIRIAERERRGRCDGARSRELRIGARVRDACSRTSTTTSTS